MAASDIEATADGRTGLLCRAAAIIAGDRSRPTTRSSRAARNRVIWPGPQPMSATTPRGVMSQNWSAYVAATVSYPALTRCSVMSRMRGKRLTQRVGNRTLGPVVGGDNDVDVVAANSGLFVGDGVAPQHHSRQRTGAR